MTRDLLPATCYQLPAAAACYLLHATVTAAAAVALKVPRGNERRPRNVAAVAHVGRHSEVAARISSLFDAENIYKLHSLKTLLCPEGSEGVGRGGRREKETCATWRCQ